MVIQIVHDYELGKSLHFTENQLEVKTDDTGNVTLSVSENGVKADLVLEDVEGIELNESAFNIGEDSYNLVGYKRLKGTDVYLPIIKKWVDTNTDSNQDDVVIDETPEFKILVNRQPQDGVTLGLNTTYDIKAYVGLRSRFLPIRVTSKADPSKKVEFALVLNDNNELALYHTEQTDTLSIPVNFKLIKLNGEFTEEVPLFIKVTLDKFNGEVNIKATDENGRNSAYLAGDFVFTNSSFDVEVLEKENTPELFSSFMG